jgi:hypothetical protein
MSRDRVLSQGNLELTICTAAPDLDCDACRDPDQSRHPGR